MFGSDVNLRVPEPVGGGGKGNTTGADREREDLANDDPGTRAPGAGKEEDEDGDEGNLGVDSRDVYSAGLTSGVLEGLVESNSDTNDGTRNWQISMPRAPQTSRGRRPHFSTV